MNVNDFEYGFSYLFSLNNFFGIITFRYSIKELPAWEVWPHWVLLGQSEIFPTDRRSGVAAMQAAKFNNKKM